MSDNSKLFETTSASATSKRPPTRPLCKSPVPKTEFGGSNQPKSATAERIEAERDRPRNLFPTSHKTHAAKFTPDPDDPRDVLRRSTEHNTARSPFTFQVPYTSRCVHNTAGATNGHQTFQYRPCTEHRRYKSSKSTLEYQIVPLEDRRDSLEQRADEATTFLRPSQPQILVGPSGELYMEIRTASESLLTAMVTARVAAPVHRGHVAPSQSPATPETPNSPSRTKDRRHIELHDRILAVRPSGVSPIGVKHEVDSRLSSPINDASIMERAPVILRASNYHGSAQGAAPWNHSQDPLPFQAHSPVHPILIPNYEPLEERYSRNLRQEESLPAPKRVDSVETNLISNESGADKSHTSPSLRSSPWPGAERPRLSTPQRGSEVATLERNSSEHGPIHRTFQTSDTRAIDSPVPDLLNSPRSENAPSSTALTTPNGSRRRKQIPLPRQDTAAPEDVASVPPETNFVTRQRAPSLRAGSTESGSMSTGPSPSNPHTNTKKPASSAGSSSSAEAPVEDRRPKTQSRTPTTSPSHMDFYGSSTFDWDLPSSTQTNLLFNSQYQHPVTVSPHQLHTPYTHHHYHHHQHISPFSLQHQPTSSILYPPAPPTYPTSIPPHLTTLNHAQSTHIPSPPFHPEPPPSYVPLAPTQHGGKEKPQFVPHLFYTVTGNPLLVNHGSGSSGGPSTSTGSGGGDRRGKDKAVDRSTSTASTSTTGKKRKRESSAADDEGVDVKQRRTGKKKDGVDGEEDDRHGMLGKEPPSPQDKKTGRKRNNKIDIACNHCRSRKLKCDGARPTCTNCTKRPVDKSRTSPPPECEFDPFPRRRGPAKHKQLKLDVESESSWPLVRVVPRTRARAAAEAKILVPTLRVGADRSASTSVSESSFAGDSVAYPSATPIHLGGEVEILATPAALSTRETTPAVDERNEPIEEPRVSKEEEQEERPRVEDGEEREERPMKDEEKPKKGKSPKKEEKKVATIKVDGDEEKVDLLKAAWPESSPSHYLPCHHSTLYPSTITYWGDIGGPVAATMPTKRSPSAVAIGGTAACPSHAGSAQAHEEEQGGASDEDHENSDDDYDSQGEESE